MLLYSDFPVPDSTMTLEPSTLIVVPTSTSEAPPPNLQTSTAWMPTVSPTPEPVPPTDDEPFFNYLNQTLFLFIQSIRIEYSKSWFGDGWMCACVYVCVCVCVCVYVCACVHTCAWIISVGIKLIKLAISALKIWNVFETG